ncbi:Ras GTPase [Linnemannia schmuckeri]|uniref:Ras GTPase n=1 Tax=Linnemannia schmuckeri TaxID=64567 RepID=A0A9P5S007_9FUNG|nr:Ras GTPase [Linnemannia schmuckeri]
MTSGPRFSIVVMGDGAVGKSAMTLRFLRDQYDPTIEDSYCKHVEVDGQEYTLDIIDTAGQHEYRGHWNDQFMRAGDGFICVYSIASMGSFNELAVFRNQIWQAKESENVPMIVAANKNDLSEARQVDSEIGMEFARLTNASYIETSAKTGFNIHEMVHELVREIVRSRQREGYADMINYQQHPLHQYQYQQQQQQQSDKGEVSLSMGYVKSPTPAGPIGMDVEDDGSYMENRRCCCIIM